MIKYKSLLLIAFLPILAFANNDFTTTKEKKEPVTQTATLTQGFQNGKAFKSFTFSRQDVGDCEWRKESITIYSDGGYTDIFELKDHGTVFGDTFTTVLHANNDQGHTYGKWQWRRSLPAKGELHDQVSGNKRELGDSFNHLNKISRTIHCG